MRRWVIEEEIGGGDGGDGIRRVFRGSRCVVAEEIGGGDG